MRIILMRLTRLNFKIVKGIHVVEFIIRNEIIDMKNNNHQKKYITICP